MVLITVSQDAVQWKLEQVVKSTTPGDKSRVHTVYRVTHWEGKIPHRTLKGTWEYQDVTEATLALPTGGQDDYTTYRTKDQRA